LEIRWINEGMAGLWKIAESYWLDTPVPLDVYAKKEDMLAEL
jgi:hypothetical protein